MKRFISFCSLMLWVSISAFSGNLSTAQIAQLAKMKTISAISRLATSNGYKPAYKKSGAKGYEGYDVTDMAWAYNATYDTSMNAWRYGTSYSAIKLLYNNSLRQPETIVFVISDGSYFSRVKKQITSYGYTFYQEDTNMFNNAVAYCYYNEALKMYAIFEEPFGNQAYQIHFYQ